MKLAPLANLSRNTLLGLTLPEIKSGHRVIIIDVGAKTMKRLILQQGRYAQLGDKMLGTSSRAASKLERGSKAGFAYRAYNH